MKKISCAALVLLALATPVLAAPGGRHGGEPRSERSSSDLADILITATERALIGEYYKSHAVPAESLPPGIRKKVARGKPLPPGIAKRFPDGLSGQLRARPGYEFRTVGADVVLVEIASGVIADVIKGVLR
ncbi:MAG: anti-virulence regulator CigR family protein [Bacteroidota bacterium]